ncbi:helix-turn-helix transcriptional regulator [Streptomyces sp. NPDC051940]|uniref:helix-turn-helix transcriptional regulator n=1 Tax=Streptomyces sp. NPDC051940 TaxID=3155675 RepID=UPI003419A472
MTMNRRAELGEFLRSRRARLSPEEVGLPSGGRRRVPGLRREELALLAGVSVDHYVRLEQGRDLQFSESVLDAVAGVLRLDATERAHLRRLALPGKAGAAAAGLQVVRPGLLRLLSSMDDVPAYVVGRNVSVLAWNPLAAALIADFGALPPRERNLARLVFLDPAMRELYADWPGKASDVVAYLRYDAGRHPGDPSTAALIGELGERSAEFRTLWAEHRLRDKTHGRYVYRHPLAGELDLGFETLRLPDDPDQALVAHTVEEGSASAAALRTLAARATAREDA